MASHDRQVIHRAQRGDRLGALDTALDFQGFLRELDRVFEQALHGERDRQVVRGPERERVFGTEGPPLDRDHFLEDLLLLGELPHPVQDDGEVVHRADGFRVLGAELLPAELDRALLLLERLLLVAQVPVAHAEGVSYRRLDKGLAGERRGDLRLGTVERLADRRVAAQPTLLALRPGGREHLVLEKLEHGACPRLGPFRLPELLGRVVPRQSAWRSASRARMACQVARAVPPSSDTATATAATTATRCRAANFAIRYAVDGGRASMASPRK